MKSYRYVDGTFETEIDVKRSRFIASVTGEVDAEGAEAFVRQIKKRYPDARHNCYAYVGDEKGNVVKFSDDGEPQGTAGQPMLEVLKKRGIKKSAIVVTRYFGGILLGAAGLLGAYTEAAAKAIDTAVIKTKTERRLITIDTDYTSYQAVDKLLRKLGLNAQTEFSERVNADVWVRVDDAECVANQIVQSSLGRANVALSDGDCQYIDD